MGTAGTHQGSVEHRLAVVIPLRPRGVEDQPQVMEQLARLARLQRACLTLCVVGGHTYRDVADLLGISPRIAAGLVDSGLDELSRSGHHVSTVRMTPT